MVRTSGLTYACEPGAAIGARISDMRLNGRPVEADKAYKVARWGVGAPQSPAKGMPVWGIVEQYLRQPVNTHTPNVPRLIGVGGNPGIAVDGGSPT